MIEENWKTFCDAAPKVELNPAASASEDHKSRTDLETAHHYYCSEW